MQYSRNLALALYSLVSICISIPLQPLDPPRCRYDIPISMGGSQFNTTDPLKDINALPTEAMRSRRINDANKQYRANQYTQAPIVNQEYVDPEIDWLRERDWRCAPAIENLNRCITRNNSTYSGKKILSADELEYIAKLSPTELGHCFEVACGTNDRHTIETIALAQLHLYSLSNFCTYIKTLPSYPAFVDTLDDTLATNPQFERSLNHIRVPGTCCSKKEHATRLPAWIRNENSLLQKEGQQKARSIATALEQSLPNATAAGHYKREVAKLATNYRPNSREHNLLQVAHEQLEETELWYECDDAQATGRGYARSAACLETLANPLAPPQKTTFEFSPKAKNNLLPLINPIEYEMANGNPLQNQIHIELCEIMDNIGKHFDCMEHSPITLIHSQTAIQTSEYARMYSKEGNYKTALSLADFGWAAARGIQLGLKMAVVNIFSYDPLIDVALITFLPSVFFAKTAISLGYFGVTLAKAGILYALAKKDETNNNQPFDPIAFTEATAAFVTSTLAMGLARGKVMGWAGGASSFPQVFKTRMADTKLGNTLGQLDNGASRLTNMSWFAGQEFAKNVQNNLTLVQKHGTGAFTKAASFIHKHPASAMLCRAAARGKILKLTDFGQMLPKGQTLNGLSHTMLGEIDLVNGTLISGMHTLWGLKIFKKLTGHSFKGLPQKIDGNGVRTVYFTKKMIDEQRWDRAKKTTINGTDYITKTIFPKNTCIHKLISYAQDILSDQSNKAGINKYTGTTNSGIPGTIYLDAKDNVATHFPLSKE